MDKRNKKKVKLFLINMPSPPLPSSTKRPGSEQNVHRTVCVYILLAIQCMQWWKKYSDVLVEIQSKHPAFSRDIQNVSFKIYFKYQKLKYS